MKKYLIPQISALSLLSSAVKQDDGWRFYFDANIKMEIENFDKQQFQNEFQKTRMKNNNDVSCFIKITSLDNNICQIKKSVITIFCIRVFIKIFVFVYQKIYILPRDFNICWAFNLPYDDDIRRGVNLKSSISTLSKANCNDTSLPTP